MSRGDAAPAAAPTYRHRPRPGRLAGLVTVVATIGGAACGLWGAPEPGTPAAEADSLLRREGPPVGLDVVNRLDFPPLRFNPPRPERFELSNGVTVFFLRDASLPVVDVFIDVKGGYVYFDREYYGAASAMLPMMRNGGTETMSPDSVDEVIEFHALGMSTSTDGGRMLLGVSGLRRQLDLAVGLWGEILLHPRFDADAVERWRVRELEATRRIGDFPGSLAVLEFNRLMYGDHPTGWMMTEGDLTPERVSPDRLRSIHRRAMCPEGAVIGAAGDVSRDELRAALEGALAGWQPCGTELSKPPDPELHQDPGIYVIPRTLSQSTIVIGQPGGVLLRESDDYFASRIANWVIGGSGFTSRLVRRLRTQEGLAYSAASIWGSARDHERIFGAITHTKSESTVSAIRVVLETLEDARRDPPNDTEIELARESIVNGFVFGFNSPAQVVARQVSYLADGFPEDWLDRYLRGVRAIDSTDVTNVIRKHIRPDAFTILVVGDTTVFDLGFLGPYQVLPGH